MDIYRRDFARVDQRYFPPPCFSTYGYIEIPAVVRLKCIVETCSKTSCWDKASRWGIPFYLLDALGNVLGRSFSPRRGKILSVEVDESNQVLQPTNDSRSQQCSTTKAKCVETVDLSLVHAHSGIRQ
jgi:hypothetical protein